MPKITKKERRKVEEARGKKGNKYIRAKNERKKTEKRKQRNMKGKKGRMITKKERYNQEAMKKWE